jgi:ornithine cyclodeaminase/alanine dehydrogenase-like protein (mu-crystallin family)
MLFLGRRDIRELLDVDLAIKVVERAFRLLGEGRARPPAVCGLAMEAGSFHVKIGALEVGARRYVASKTNANFPANPRRRGLPTIQGAIILFDAECGVPLAILDSGEITTLRTAAATAVAARWLAAPGSTVLTVCGCGVQGRAHLRALARVLPLSRVYLFDLDPAAARRTAEELGPELDVEIVIVERLTDATRVSDAVVTCTTSHSFLLGEGSVRPGTFVAGVGADSEEKRELAPSLLASARIVVDLLDSCAAMGDLHHALESGAVGRDDVHAELGEIVAGKKRARVEPDDIVVFDSTGIALQDVAAAAAVYERAGERGMGAALDLTGEAIRERPLSPPRAEASCCRP